MLILTERADMTANPLTPDVVGKFFECSKFDRKMRYARVMSVNSDGTVEVAEIPILSQKVDKRSIYVCRPDLEGLEERPTFTAGVERHKVFGIVLKEAKSGELWISQDERTVREFALCSNEPL